MCRLLLIKNKREFAVAPHLEIFAQLCRNSKEYQGHGWGITYVGNGEWRTHKELRPIWESDLDQFGETAFLMVHARSAFRDRDIAIENNMPFSDQRYTFIFNGELHRVRINAQGRIGAEKIFNFIRRLNEAKKKQGNQLDDTMALAFPQGTRLIVKRTQHLRAMNILMADMETQAVYLCSRFTCEDHYFTMHMKRSQEGFIICSQPYPRETTWREIPNNSIEVITW